MIIQMIRYFWQRNNKWHRVPLQTITPYTFLDATEQERLIMMAGRARSPMEARRLMNEYKVRTAADLIRRLPRPPRRTFRSLLRSMLMRLDGSRSTLRGLSMKGASDELPIRFRLRK